MKIQSLTRPGLIALGIAGVAAAALLGFAAGVAVTRDPDAVRRTTRRVARDAALGLERHADGSAGARALGRFAGRGAGRGSGRCR